MKQGSDRLSLPPRQGGWPALAFGPPGGVPRVRSWTVLGLARGRGQGASGKKPPCSWEPCWGPGGGDFMAGRRENGCSAL